MTTLQTERLRLREATEDDAAFVLELLNDRGFIENIADRGVRTLEEARAYIRDRMIAQYAEHGFGMWVAELLETGEPVGLTGLVRREGLDDPDIGYAYLERACGRGYAKEAAAAVLRHAREALGIGRLVAITAPHNRASMAVLEKIGLKFQGTIHVPGIGENTFFTTP